MKTPRYTSYFIQAASLLIVMLVLAACQKVETAASDPNVAVIEAYVTPGSDILLHVTRQLAFQDDDTTISPIEGLQIQVSDGDTTVVCTVDSAGYYHAPLKADQQKTYSLAFVYNYQQVTASTYIPSKPTNYVTSATSIVVSEPGSGGSGGEPPQMPDPIALSWDNADTSYYMVVIENVETDPVLIYDTSDNRPVRVFRNEPERSSSHELMPMSFSYYGTHRVVLFHLNPEYAQLYESNGSTSLNLAEPPTNVVNGLGVFTGINSDTLWIEVKEE